jgi:Lrp/AsnC family leucine-responsive transcriptional regulator
MELDRIDIALLDHLQREGRATTLELAEKVGLSPSPCHRRQKILEEAGIIRAYVALLDQEQVGLPVNVFVTIELASHAADNLTRFEAAVAGCPEVMECYEMTGTSDYLLRIVCADLAAYERFMRAKLTRVEGVRAIRSAFALKRVIYRTNLPLPGAGK